MTGKSRDEQARGAIMALKIVGTGLGRTGTKSLQSAMNMLGCGPCHHMIEVFAHPESTPLWIEAAKGRPDWEAIFAGYHAVVDYPGAQFWRELTAYYPNAKVLHTVRDPDQWFDSTQVTIFSPRGPSRRPSSMTEFFNIFLNSFGDHLHDRAFMTDYFRKHTREVVRAIPAERLLVYEVSQGWGPLCEFLGVPVPGEPFPTQNSRAEFIARQQGGAPP
jgi:hypothetical protein